VVQLIDGHVLDSIECARRGDAYPLVDRFRRGEATEQEYATVLEMAEGKFKFRRVAARAHSTLKAKAMVAYYNRLRQLDWSPKAAKDATHAELGRARGMIDKALQKYGDDPNLKANWDAGEKFRLTTPWASRYFEPVLTTR
jgi:hypothetical protein